MYVNRLCLFIAALSLIGCTPKSTAPEYTGATVAFINGAVYTADTEMPWAEAVVVDGANIVYVGDNAGAADFIGASTRKIDLGGRMLLPGFHDTHAHPEPGGMNLTVRCNVSGIHVLELIQSKLTECATTLPSGAWLEGSGWSTGSFPNANPMKEWLDAIPGEHPIYLDDEGGHSAWANSLAFEKAGIDADTPDPHAGIIMRDKDGNPTGTLREHAMSLVSDLLPKASTEVRLNALRAAMAHANSFGVTAMVDAMVVPEMDELYRTLEANDELTVRFNLAYYLEPDWDGNLDELVARQKHDNEMLTGMQVKLWMDGVLEAQTAAVKTPYVGQPDNYGILSYSDEFVSHWIPKLEAAGFQMHLHTLGDAAVAQALGGLEMSRDINHAPNNRPYFVHNYLIDTADYPRLAAAGATLNFTMLWDQMDPVMLEATLPYVTEEQFENIMPMGIADQRELIVTGGSDWPVTQISPLASIEVAVTGLSVPYHLGMPTEKDQPQMVGERVSLETMIAAYTINAAYASRQEDIIGSVTVGKRADLIVLENNLFEIPASDINETAVLMTLVNGNIVYEVEL